MSIPFRGESARLGDHESVNKVAGTEPFRVLTAPYPVPNLTGLCPLPYCPPSAGVPSPRVMALASWRPQNWSGTGFKEPYSAAEGVGAGFGRTQGSAESFSTDLGVAVPILPPRSPKFTPH